MSRIERVVEERKIPNKDEYISDRRWRLRGSGKFSQSTTSIQYISSSTRWEAKVMNSQKDVFTWLHTVGKYSISDRNNITTGELLFEKEVFQFEIRYGEKKSDFSTFLVILDSRRFSIEFSIGYGEKRESPMENPIENVENLIFQGLEKGEIDFTLWKTFQKSLSSLF